MNPIENLWTWLRSIICGYLAAFNHQELPKIICRRWKELARDQSTCMQKSTYSMKARIDAIIRANGYITKY